MFALIDHGKCLCSIPAASVSPDYTLGQKNKWPYVLFSYVSQHVANRSKLGPHNCYAFRVGALCVELLVHESGVTEPADINRHPWKLRPFP